MSIKFHLPDFVGNIRMNLWIIDKLKEHPEYFYDDIQIGSSYGCFPPAAWNGGRTAVGAVRKEHIPLTISAYNQREVPIRYTFTNPCVTAKDLADPFCNYIAKAAENGFNEAIVNVPVLEEYIRDKYAGYPLISSTVKQLEKPDQVREELKKDYKLVVLDYNFNNRFDILEQLPEKDRIEILINPYCSPACKRRGEHYRFLGKLQLAHAARAYGDKSPKTMEMLEKTFACPNMDMSFYDTVGYCTHISAEAVYEKYVPMGYTNFKIEGRMMHAVDILESYMYYLVRPEWRDRVRMKALRDLLGKK